MPSKSDNIGVKIYDKPTEVIEELFESLLSTTIHKTLEKNSTFYVVQRTTGKDQFLFSAVFC